MSSGPPSISSGYAPNDPRRGSALYGRYDEAFARQYAFLILAHSWARDSPMASLDNAFLCKPTALISGLPQDLHRLSGKLTYLYSRIYRRQLKLTSITATRPV